jgi:hypothetical protein
MHGQGTSVTGCPNGCKAFGGQMGVPSSVLFLRNFLLTRPVHAERNRMLLMYTLCLQVQN